jgi:hypothetical protein
MIYPACLVNSRANLVQKLAKCFSYTWPRKEKHTKLPIKLLVIEKLAAAAKKAGGGVFLITA